MQPSSATAKGPSGTFSGFLSHVSDKISQQIAQLLDEDDEVATQKVTPLPEELREAQAKKIANQVYRICRSLDVPDGIVDLIERTIVHWDLNEELVPKAVSQNRIVLNLSESQNIDRNSFLQVAKNVRGCSELNLSYSTVSDDALPPAISTLAHNSPSLQTLNMEGAVISTAGLKTILTAFGHIKSLNVSLLNIKDPAEFVNILIPWVKDNPELELLDCRDLRLNHEQILKLIDALPRTIHSFGISFIDKSSTEENFCEAMTKLSEKCGGKLQSLCIDEGEKESETEENDSVMTEESFALLEALFPQLSDLECQLNEDMSAKVIKETYSKWAFIKTLNLSNTMINDGDLSEMLRNCKRIRTLNIGNCGSLSCTVFKKVANDLNRSYWLRSLNISGYHFISKGQSPDPAFTALAPILPRLTEFEFSWENDFKDPDFLFLAENLNPDLKDFSMKANETITVEGLVAGFTKLQQSCPNICSLSLHGNIKAFAQPNVPLDKILGGFKNLQEVSLKGLNIDIKILEPALQALLENNPHIKTIDMRGISFSPNLEDLAKIDTRIGKTIHFRLK